MESILYSVQEEIEEIKTVNMLEGKILQLPKKSKIPFVKPLNKKFAYGRCSA